MSHIEYDAVPLGDRPVIQGLFAHYAKYVVGARAGVKQSGMKVMPDADSSSESSHGVFPFSWMQRPREGCAKIQRWVARWLGGLRWSLPDLWLSIEMITKQVLSSKNTIEFRDVSFQINDI